MLLQVLELPVSGLLALELLVSGLLVSGLLALVLPVLVLLVLVLPVLEVQVCWRALVWVLMPSLESMVRLSKGVSEVNVHGRSFMLKLVSLSTSVLYITSLVLLCGCDRVIPLICLKGQVRYLGLRDLCPTEASLWFRLGLGLKARLVTMVELHLEKFQPSCLTLAWVRALHMFVIQMQHANFTFLAFLMLCLRI